MAQRPGSLKGEMLRLNALGERLVQMANLDAGEFDFRRAPPVGGPESSDALNADANDIVRDLTILTSLLGDRGRKLDLLEELIMNRQIEERILPAGKPVRSGWISSDFGMRTDPETGKWALHKGVDFVAKRGSGGGCCRGAQRVAQQIRENRREPARRVVGNTLRTQQHPPGGEGRAGAAGIKHCHPRIERAHHRTPRPFRGAQGRQHRGPLGICAAGWRSRWGQQLNLFPEA